MKRFLCWVLCGMMCLAGPGYALQVQSGNPMAWADAHYQMIHEQEALTTAYFRENCTALTEYAQLLLQEYVPDADMAPMPEHLSLHGFDRVYILPEQAMVEFRKPVMLAPEGAAALYGDIVLNYFEGSAIYEMHQSWLPFVIFADTECEQVWTCTFCEYE